MSENPSSGIKDQGLLFLVMLLGTGVTGTSAGLVNTLLAETNDSNRWAIPVLVAGVVIIALVGLSMYYRHIDRETVRQMNSRVNQLDDLCTKANDTIGELKAELASPPVRLITKRDYAAILKEWNDLGVGYLLLYNIELQSFENEQEIENTWGKLSALTNINGVVLLLPKTKVHRWEEVVLREESRFFADEANRKFYVCEIASGDDDKTEGAPSGIAFAIYRLGDDPDTGELLDSAVVFVLSEPFSASKEPFVPEDSHWWDYRKILSFDRAKGLATRADVIWHRYFDKSRMRDVARVLIDTKPLEPIEPAVLFDRLGVSESRKLELLRHFDPRKLLAIDPQRVPQDRTDGSFTLSYDNGQTVEGHYSGVDTRNKHPRCSIIWVGGFTERHETRLPELFERALKKESVVQFFYEVSPPLQDFTLTRCAEDMREVLRFVNSQTDVVMANELVLIARSINGFIGALVASEDEFLKMLAGVILVAPVFDVIEMINNYRASSGHDHVRVENCWRASPGYEAQKWENPRKKYRWLEFFGHDVNLTPIADIIRHGADYCSLRAFKESVGKISLRRPIYILSHPEDPITGSRRALEVLSDAASGTGLIKQKNYRYVPILSSHLPVKRISADSYPWKLRAEAREARDALREIMNRLKLPAMS